MCVCVCGRFLYLCHRTAFQEKLNQTHQGSNFGFLGIARLQAPRGWGGGGGGGGGGGDGGQGRAGEDETWKYANEIELEG